MISNLCNSKPPLIMKLDTQYLANRFQTTKWMHNHVARMRKEDLLLLEIDVVHFTSFFVGSNIFAAFHGIFYHFNCTFKPRTFFNIKLGFKNSSQNNAFILGMTQYSIESLKEIHDSFTRIIFSIFLYNMLKKK